jgi:hypothetical protein
MLPSTAVLVEGLLRLSANTGQFPDGLISSDVAGAIYVQTFGKLDTGTDTGNNFYLNNRYSAPLITPQTLWSKQNDLTAVNPLHSVYVDGYYFEGIV